MKKAIYTGIFYTILGLCINTPANASLISRSSLDQALTDYATTTALDLKANQSDLTDLSNKIGTLPDGLTVADLYDGWTDSNGGYISGLSAMAKADFTTYDPLGDTINTGLKPESGGYLNVLASLMYDGFTPFNNSVLAPFWYLTKQAMRVGEIPRGRTVAAMIDEINTKIGTLPSGNIDYSSIMKALFQFTQVTDTPVYPNSLSDLIYQLYGGGFYGSGAFDVLIEGFNSDYFGKDAPVMGIIPAMELGLNAKTAAETAQATATEAKTAADANTTKIGTLPTEYETVGAALSAIKGIAEEAKAAALAAIPDPKTEGSNGKYVLTVDILEGDATYRWEPIDRGNTTTTTE